MNKWECIKKELYNNGGLSISDIEDMEERKKDLDQINFFGTYRKTGDELVLPDDDPTRFAFIKPCLQEYKDSKIYPAYRAIKELMTVDPEVRIGTISHGTHSIDYFTHYFSLDMIHQTQWKSSRVMFVFEAPASNLGASYGFINKYECFDSDWEKRQKIKKEHIKEFLSEAEKWEEPEAFSNLLSYHRWWLDRTEKTEEESCNWTNDMARHLQQGKEYCYSITTLMKIFGLANIYTTNIMRFELYKGANKGNEVSLNWNNAQKLRKSDNGESVIDIAYKDIFLKEIEKFKPDIIFATANPCNYLSWEKRLKNDLKKKEFEFEYDIPICKIPHPANQKTTNEHRLCLNICFIAKMLAERGIITYDEAQEAIYTYYLSLRMK